MFKRTLARAGNLFNYAWYVPLLFIMYFGYDVFLSTEASPLPSTVSTILGWVFSLVLNPLVMAGLFGAIYQQQKSAEKPGTGSFLSEFYGQQSGPEKASIGGFLGGMKRYFWPIAGANLILTVVRLIAIVAASMIGGPDRPQSELRTAVAFVDVPFTMIILFWYAALVTEGDLFRSLWRGLRALVVNPVALGIGLIWGAVGLEDDLMAISLGDQGALAARAALSVVLATFRVLTAVYALAVYREMRGESAEPASPQVIDTLQPSVVETAAVPAAPAAPPAQGLIRTSFGFAFFAFVPLVHLLTLGLGILALKRSGRFVLRSAIACAAGAFFTAFYLLIVAGWLVSAASPSSYVSIGFLAEANRDLAPQVALLRDGSYADAQKQLEALGGSPSRHWTVDTALALAKSGQNDLDGALDTFYTASHKFPERSEFYYYYGLTLLDNDQQEMALKQFQLAAAHSPKLPRAALYATLVSNAYKPSPELSAAFFIIILLILFTVHEYGHAFAAWKLGDDTAKNAGRLTLNPIKHLDLFGSIILPGILLYRQSDIIFGWAKPVPVNPQNFKDPRKDHMRVSFAGPAVNLLVAMGCFILLGLILLVIRLFWPETVTMRIIAPYGETSLVGPPYAHWLLIAIIFIKQLMYTSLALGFFNLLPIPPLDGSWILAGFLPESLMGIFEVARRFGIALFLLLSMTPVIDYYVAIPTLGLWGGLQLVASAVGL